MLQEVMTSPGVIEFRDVPIPEIRDDQVLVKMMRLGICGSDIHVYHGKHPYTKYPVTQGHEVSGEIVQVGSAVKGLEVGQKVVLEPQVTCGKCYPCTHGKYNLCTELKVMGFQTTGAASEYFAVDASKVDVIPDSMSYDEAALIEPLTIALAAAEQAHISYGKSVAIMGAGGIGLMLVQLARLAGASCVTVFDLVEEKCELAKQLGADYAFDPRKEGALEEAMKVAGGAYACSRAPVLSPPRRTRSSSSPATATASISQCTAKTRICRSICTRTSTGIRSTCTVSSWARACSPRPSSSLRV